MIPARAKAQVSIPMPFDKLKNDSEYFVKVQFLLKDDMPWAEKGFVTAEEQNFVAGSYGASFHQCRDGFCRKGEVG